MPIRNYTVGTEYFNPYTYEELSIMPKQMTEAHDKLEADNADLMSKAELLNYYMSQNPDSRAAKSYHGFMDRYEQAADNLANNGLSNNTKRDALELRKMYNSSIVPIAEGIERYQKAVQSAPDGNIGNVGTIDDYVYNPGFQPTYIDPADISKAMKGFTDSLSQSMTPQYVADTPDGQQRLYRTGLDETDMMLAFMAANGESLVLPTNDGTTHDFSDMVNTTLVDRIGDMRDVYGYADMTPKQQQMFDNALYQGVSEGLGKVTMKSNPDYMNTYQRRSLQLRENAAANKDNGSSSSSSSSSGGGRSSNRWMTPDKNVTIPSYIDRTTYPQVEFDLVGSNNDKQFRYRKDENSPWQYSSIYDVDGNIVKKTNKPANGTDTTKETKPQVPIWETGDNDTPATTKMTTSRIEGSYDEKLKADDIQNLDKNKKKYADASKLQGQLRKAGINDQDGYYYRKGSDWYFVPKAQSNTTNKGNADIDYNAK